MPKFIDLNPTFAAHPKTGDLTRLYDENSIKNSIKSLILTNHYEVPFAPWKGGNLIDLLFEPVTQLTSFKIKKRIEDTITNEEPRVTLKNVYVSFNESYNAYDVKIHFTINNDNTPIILNMILRRER